MKTQIILLIICIILFSCSRNEDENHDDQKYFIKLTINDAAKEEYAKKSPTGYGFEKSNFEEHASSSKYRLYALDLMNIDIYDYPLKVKNYNWSNANTNNIMSLTRFSYVDPETNKEYTYMYSSNMPLYNESSNLSFTINQTSNGEVKGTFSGKIVAYDTKTSPYTKKVFNIKNGEVYMPINKFP